MPSLLKMFACVILVVALGPTLFGCGDPATGAVQETITATHASGRDYETGPLKGGTAVLVDNMAAYWVIDGEVYAANGVAKSWSPSTEYTIDHDVTMSSVERAVQ